MLAHLPVTSWHDETTILLNPHTPLSIFLPPNTTHTHIHLLLPRNTTTTTITPPTFLLRIHPWSLNLLATLLSSPTHASKNSNTLALALNYTLNLPDFATNHLEVPARWFASSPARKPAVPDDAISPAEPQNPSIFEPGDLLTQFSILEGPTLKPTMLAYLSHVDSPTSDFIPDVKHTALRTEIKAFWAAELQKMAREREEAGELANEAEKGLERWSGKISDGEKKLVEEAVGILRDVLGERWKGGEGDGLRGVREKVGELRKVCLICRFGAPISCGDHLPVLE